MSFPVSGSVIRLVWVGRELEILTYSCLLIKAVARELYGRIRDDTNAISTIASHQTPPALVFPHLHEPLPNWQLISGSSSALYLKQYFQTLKRRDDCPRDCSGNTTSNECGENGLGNGVP